MTATQTLMLLIYPAYNVIFLRLNGLAQLGFILVLPIIKHALSFLLLHVSIGILSENTLGTVSIEFFSIVFVQAHTIGWFNHIRHWSHRY